ncbi:MAG: 16S rRNA (guanine(527)-N(7))-methyltransferase RsmG, partial [Chloroflexota bacterium]
MTLAEQAAALLEVTLTPEQETQFDLYARELAVWNVHTNLTAITEYNAVQVRHFLDSLTVLKSVPLSPAARVIDVGTGAGFPGLAMKIARPDIYVALLEATGKKVAFLQHMIDLLKLDSVETVKARAEDAAHDDAHRTGYDLVVARAVARLP